MSLGDHWQRQYEHMKNERDELRELYRAAQEMLNEALVNVNKIKAEAWDAAIRDAHYHHWLHDWALSDALAQNPYREGE